MSVQAFLHSRQMKRFIIVGLLLGAILMVSAQEDSVRRKIVRGFDGGMMVHAGYQTGTIVPLDYQAQGATFGLGGVIRIHLGEHWMLGTEGYMSVMSQLKNGSYIKWGWGGILGEFYWAFKRVMPYVGLTLGGGSLTTFLMFDGNSGDWENERDAIFHKERFFAADPFIGCDFIVTKSMHLTLKADWLSGIGKTGLLKPYGPRFYFGFIFYH